MEQIINSKLSNIDRIGDAHGDEQIVNLWKQHFYDIFNENQNHNESDNFALLCNDTYDTLHVNQMEVQLGIEDLKTGKAGGHDGVCAEHLKHAGQSINRVLSVCFTAVFNGTM